MTSPHVRLLDAFNEAFNRHDVSAMMTLMTADCLFENTLPAPDGTRYEGQAAVCAYWEAFFRDAPGAHLEIEEMFASEDRAVQRLTYHWSETGHVRGVDVFRFRDGRIGEKLSYVKG